MISLSTVTEFTSSVSVAGSFIAGLYQLYMGYVFEGADGFSPILLCGWLLGDLCNVIGTFWTHQLLFQRIISVASLSNDLALVGQHIYYLRKHKQMLVVPDPVNVDGNRYLAMRWNALLRPYILFTLVSAARAQKFEAPLFIVNGSGEDCLCDDFADWKFLIGQCMAWVAEISYAFALIPQACENLARKSTGSVSLTMFVADAIGSMNYLATILITATEKPSEYAMINFLLEELPYIFGTALCTLLDFVLLSQYFMYPQFVVEVSTGEDETNSINQLVYPRETTPLQPFRSWKSYNAANDRS